MQKQFSEITDLISQARLKVYHAANKELVNLYWHIGKYLSEQVASKAWGKSVVKDLSDYIQKKELNIKGFSAQNLWRMKQFYETYKDIPKLSPLVREISWTNNLWIFQDVKPGFLDIDYFILNRRKILGFDSFF